MNMLDVRTLSVTQLKDMKNQINRSTRRWLWRQQFTQTIDGVSVDDIKSELKRRKIQKLKLGRLNLGK